jgi:2-polyprenyl-3-methyl-5-hydroxy-6-metoxy-1,4-benzoquinol methylase
VQPHYLELELPTDRADPQRQPGLYRDWFRGTRGRKYVEYYRRPMEVISHVGLARGQRVLDLGCGWGYAAMLANSYGCEAYGVDIDEGSMEFGRALAAKNGFTVDLRYARSTALPFADAFFDRIISIETFEHIFPAERQRSLDELKRCLKPGGRMAISTPNAVGLAEYAKRALGRSRLMRKLIPDLADPDDAQYTQGFQIGKNREDVMVNITLTFDEMASYARAAGLTLDTYKTVILVPEFVPDRLFRLTHTVERALEPRFPFRHVGTTSVYLLSRP